MFKKIYNWYMKTFLPFEDPSHPLYSDGSIQYDEGCQEIIDFIESEMDGIGPNYARKPFSKPSEYEKWGDKWYKKGG